MKRKLKFEDNRNSLEAAQIKNKLNHLEKNKLRQIEKKINKEDKEDKKDS